MNYKELTIILQAQNKVLIKTIESLQCSLDSQNITIELLPREVKQFKTLLLEKDASNEKMTNKLNGLLKIHLPKKIEKRNTVYNSLKDMTPALTPKERGNNRSKRKEHYYLKEIPEDVEPTHPAFVMNDSIYLFSRDVVRYEYIPQRLIKHIYRCKNYRSKDGNNIIVVQLKISQTL